ncbi:origin recognition complex, subunit 6 [Bombardia bombarda]|uniref:Origin recognition complex, subunit 6 n=1 Tax=Bombardia bombarda TaxID=252184 RepID=A0AA39XJS2_9PEZI|nr:origin recognition complex, subunit 6 [Bombardia bombarda]
MNRSIEQALLSLLPTHNSALPPPLAELASSLLAQSRHRASTLKAEEEIARPYACAHIACDRLKISLNLPPIDPRPPVPPRIYKRLYNHLEKILPASSTPNRATPGGGLGSSPTRSRKAAATKSPLPSRVTPSKVKTLAQFRGTPAVVAKPSLTASDALSPWIRPTLRFICKELGHTRIGPVVMSGMESIVAPHGKLTDDKWVLENLVSLLGALCLFVWRGVTWPGTDLDEAQYVQFRKDLVGAVKKARKTVALKAPTDENEEEEEEGDLWEGWQVIRIKDLDTAALRISRNGWLELDWAKGIQDLAEATIDAQQHSASDDESDSSSHNRGGGEPLQIRRADTMFQERYDYLSERNKLEYAAWKEGILGRIKELERDTPPHLGGEQQHQEDPMDIDRDSYER